LGGPVSKLKKQDRFMAKKVRSRWVVTISGRDYSGGLGVLGHKGKSIGWQIRVQREKGRSSLKDAQKGGYVIKAPRQVQADDISGFHPKGG
jgi:hypothetical protein